MKVPALRLRAILPAWALSASLHCLAEPALPNIETMVGANRWQEASRALFLEARSAYRFEWSLPAAQANAGFLDDALDTITGMHPGMQPDALLDLVANVPSLPAAKAGELVQQALEQARALSGKSANYLKSGELTRIAIFYSARGAEPAARSIFEQALAAAEDGTREENSGGYRQVTQALVREAQGNQEWMIRPVAQHLERHPTTDSTAFAYRDLAQVAVRLGKNELAAELIEAGIAATNTIGRSSLEKLALDELSQLAAEAGYTKRLHNPSAYAQAMEQARAGNPEKALALVSKLSQNLYVDPAQQAYTGIFEDAVKRNDLNTALYLAEHPIRALSWAQANAWRQVAEMQHRRGASHDATNSYLRARQAISENPETIRYLEQVKAALATGASMQQNGFETDGRQATLDAIAMIHRIPERRPDDRASAATLAARTLWRYHMHPQAQQQVLNAYRIASAYSDKQAMEKARLLSELGQTTTTFTHSPSGDLPEEKETTRLP